MSGGSLNYISYNLEETSEIIKDRIEDPLYIAFSEHLLSVASALHAIEWELSGDTSEGSARKSIRSVLGENADKKAFNVSQEKARKLIGELEKYLVKTEESE